MPCDVLTDLPLPCGEQFAATTSAGWRVHGQCHRAAGHLGDHFDATLGHAWVTGARPRRAWLRFDAADLTLHFGCNDRCLWAPREA